MSDPRDPQDARELGRIVDAIRERDQRIAELEATLGDQRAATHSLTTSAIADVQRIAELTAQVAVLRDALKIVLTARCCDYGHRMCGTAAARAGSALAATEKKP